MKEEVVEDLCVDVTESKCKRENKLVTERRIIHWTNGYILEYLTIILNWLEAILGA
jgi:hypothetical protein